MYYIKDGEVELSRRVQLNGKYEDRKLFTSNAAIKNLGKNGRVIKLPARPEVIGLLGEGMVIGDDDMLNGITTWTYSAKIIHQPTSVYIIERSKFFNSTSTLGKVFDQMKKLSEVIFFW